MPGINARAAAAMIPTVAASSAYSTRSLPDSSKSHVDTGCLCLSASIARRYARLTTLASMRRLRSEGRLLRRGPCANRRVPIVQIGAEERRAGDHSGRDEGCEQHVLDQILASVFTDETNNQLLHVS